MSKTRLGPGTLLYPMPALLVGARINGRPNFMTVAWAGIVCGQPPMLGVAIQKSRYTLDGIRQTGVFSANIPAEDQFKETDYCGIVSGRQADKAAVCGFSVWDGEATGAPLIEQCPINLECRVTQELLLGSHYLVIGTIVETHVTSDCLTDGKPDALKIKPLGYLNGIESAYYSIGPTVGPAFVSGQELKSGGV